jgi:hypothetical protein
VLLWLAASHFLPLKQHPNKSAFSLQKKKKTGRRRIE